jgi:cobalt-zinc-cadmium efflux system membrane fusion protein
MKRKLYLLIGATALAGLLFTALRPARTASREASAPRTTPWLENGAINFPGSFAEREHLGLAEARQKVLTPRVLVTGTIGLDARRVVEIGGRIAGRLRAVSKVEGDKVAAGEVVAQLESLALGQAQAEVIKARARETVARADAQRERRLALAHITSERDAQLAEAEAEAATAARVAAEKGVEAMGAQSGGELGVVRLRSPLSGTVIEAHARSGQSVEPADRLYVVADLSRVWATLVVFEKDLPSIRVGDAVELTLPSDPGRRVEGTVAYLSETLDASKRAAEVRVELVNDGLRPGQSITAVIHASGPREQRLVVPRKAVTRVDGREVVFVSKGPLVVEPRAVELGAEDSDDVSIEAGLASGERVVVEGVLALKAEVFR